MTCKKCCRGSVRRMRPSGLVCDLAWRKGFRFFAKRVEFSFDAAAAASSTHGAALAVTCAVKCSSLYRAEWDG